METVRPPLRVEDAQMYLDQVKAEFADRPHIYNEFLDIMKAFKMQQTDTPGVIREISNLFQGNRKLMLGFNMLMLDGYRIEEPPDPDIGSSEVLAVFRAPFPDVALPILRESPLVLDDALAYMDQVKAEFADRPHIYNEFLDTTKAFMAQKVNTVEAIRRLNNLFQGNRRLMLGFNTFLSNGYRIAIQSDAGIGPPEVVVFFQQPGSDADVPILRESSSSEGKNLHLEFDRAVRYVKLIRRRFSPDPGTYEKFLEILQTYEAKQRGARETLEDVVELFEDHPDLLREFASFVPATLLNQAKVRFDQLG
jgi:paired amphipathic helix protein Sin3a